MNPDWHGPWTRLQQDLWRRMAAGNAGDVPADTLRRLVAFGENYADFCRKVWQPSAPAGDPSGDTATDLAATYLQAFQSALGFAPLHVTDHGPQVAALARLQRAFQAFGQLLATVAADAAGRFATASAAAQQEGASEPSLATLHERWVECGEQAWAAAAGSAPFAAAQQELQAALTEWRAAQLEFMEAWARELGLPTRAEQDELHRQLQELRRRIRDLQRELEARERHAP